jgi:arylsulfatase A-like enzyme
MIKFLLTFFAFLFVSRCIDAQVKSPNIIIINLDDLGYGDVSAYKKGSLNTPNFDFLANNGVRFKRGYSTSATCTPSRYALLTGIYPWKNKEAKILPGDAPLIIDTSITTLPKMLKKAAYRTAVVGKWHLGLGNGTIDWNKNISFNPSDVGFDYSFIMAATTDRVPTVYIENNKVVGLEENDPLYVSYRQNFDNEPTAITHPQLMSKMKWHHGHNQSVHNGIPRIGYMKGGKNALWIDEDMNDIFLQKGLAFIQSSLQRPFFLYFALHQPHVPRVPHQRFVGKSGMGPRGDAILEADWCVGEMLRKLDEWNILENTLIVLTSDNGPVLNDGYFDDAVEKVGQHTPFADLRGGKYSLYEAGTRVPFLTYWKGVIKPTVSNAMVCQLDFTASFAHLLGIAPPKGDGENLWKALLGESKSGRSELIIEATGRLAYKYENYVYIPPNMGNPIVETVQIENGNAPEDQLYHLKKDIGQRVNLAKSKAGKLVFMKAKMAALLSE